MLFYILIILIIVIILLPNGKKKIEQFKIFDIKRDILQHTNDMAKYLIL